jgi:hypothetical protein
MRLKHILLNYIYSWHSARQMVLYPISLVAALPCYDQYNNETESQIAQFSTQSII